MNNSGAEILGSYYFLEDEFANETHSPHSGNEGTNIYLTDFSLQKIVCEKGSLALPHRIPPSPRGPGVDPRPVR